MPPVHGSGGPDYVLAGRSRTNASSGFRSCLPDGSIATGLKQLREPGPAGPVSPARPDR